MCSIGRFITILQNAISDDAIWIDPKTQLISPCLSGLQELKGCSSWANPALVAKVCQGAWSAARARSSHPSSAKDGAGLHNTFAELFKICSRGNHWWGVSEENCKSRVRRKVNKKRCFWLFWFPSICKLSRQLFFYYFCFCPTEKASPQSFPIPLPCRNEQETACWNSLSFLYPTCVIPL